MANTSQSGRICHVCQKRVSLKHLVYFSASVVLLMSCICLGQIAGHGWVDEGFCATSVYVWVCTCIRVREKDVPVFVMYFCQLGLLHGVVWFCLSVWPLKGNYHNIQNPDKNDYVWIKSRFCPKKMPPWQNRAMRDFSRNIAGPCLKLSSKTHGTLDKVHLLYLRLSLPVKCKDAFTSRSVPVCLRRLYVCVKSVSP